MKLTLKALLTLASATGVFCANLTAGPFQTISVPDPTLVPASAGGDSLTPMMTPDGRYVVFSSTAANLATNANGTPLSQTFPAKLNVFLRDRTTGTTTLISGNDVQTNGPSGDSIPDDISTNGQFVAFESRSFVATKTNFIGDIYQRDVVNGTTALISIATDGGPANGISRSAVMTPEGRYIAFVSAATNLVENDTNNIPDIFLRDTWSNTTTLISVGATAAGPSYPFTNFCESPEITPDGRYVAFYSTATNVVAGITNTAGEIYLRDTVAGTTICASIDAHAIASTNNISYDHCLSADGQFVAYQAKSTQSGPGAYFPWGIVLRYNVATATTDIIDTNGWAPIGPNEEVRTLDMTPDGRYVVYMANFPIVSSGQIAPNVIKVWDAQTGLSTLVSANINGFPSTNYVCDSPSIDPTGRFVTFISNAPDLVSNSVPAGYHCYIRDLQLNTTTLVDVNTNGATASLLPTTLPRLSADARYVAFSAFDNQLVPSDVNHAHDIFVRDLSTGNIDLISAREASMPSSTASGLSILSRSSISGDGRFVGFSSLAENLVTNDNNQTRDIFVRDLLTGSTRLISVSSNGVSANNGSFDPSMSADGRYVVFASYANDIAPVTLAYRNAENIYLADLQTGTTTLISQVGGVTANANSFSPLISRNGTFVIFHSRATNLGGGSGENLFLYSLQSSNLIALTSGGVTDAAISDNGRFVVFSGIRSGTSALFVWDTQLGAITVANTGAYNARSIVLTRDGSRYTYTAGVPSQFLYDNTTNNLGPMATFGHYSANFSADGNLLAYGTPTDIQLYDFTTHTSVLVSHAYSSTSTAANGISDFPDISADGRYVVYRSTASNLVQSMTFPDTNGAPRLYVYDTQTGINSILSTGADPASGGNLRSFPPVFSADGHTVVFSSYATDLVNGDFNESTDLFEFAFLYADVKDSPDGVTISWPAAPGQTYHVQYKDNVDDPNWQILNGTITITGNRASITDTSATSAHRIYRVAAF